MRCPSAVRSEVSRSPGNLRGHAACRRYNVLMSGVWRLIIDSPAHGAWNMAVDEAILEQTGRGESPPTLRLYDWQPACLSLGYAQPFADVDVDRLKERGWELVRRPTGGRAILHVDELTYSVSAPASDDTRGWFVA